MNRIREKMMRFMQGRNGFDQLSQFLNMVVLVIFVISLFVKWAPLYYLGLGLLVYMYFRVFSRNIPKRYAENQKFCNFRYDAAIKKNKNREKFIVFIVVLCVNKKYVCQRDVGKSVLHAQNVEKSL